ncbi:MAG: ribosome assembly RNA-binding protein YhbY [Gammaproteobacteria bacterium]|nr:ribosome assembly RNA-binding protein YhbY [Gammaproteobacteria bacterium]
MPLNEKQKRHLRGLLHDRKPVVMIGGAGLTDNVMQEIENALAHHELIKVKIAADDRPARATMIEQIAETTKSELVQTIGHTASFYRQADTPKLVIPKN